MTETFNYNYIRNEYGVNVLNEIRTFENISKTKGRYTSHLRFYLQCKHVEIVPKGIRIKSQMKSREAKEIVRKAEKALINTRIGEVIRKNKLLEKKKIHATEKLKQILPPNLHNTIVILNERRQLNELIKSSEIQIKKYRNLLREKYDATHENATLRENIGDVAIQDGRPAAQEVNTESAQNEEVHGGTRIAEGQEENNERNTGNAAEDEREIEIREVEETGEINIEESTESTEENTERSENETRNGYKSRA